MPNATLTIARPQATSLLQHQLGEGQRLLALAIEDRLALAQASQEKSAWSLRNRQLLFRVFEDNSGIEGYGGPKPISYHASVALQVEHFRQEIRAHLACLERVLKRVG